MNGDAVPAKRRCPLKNYGKAIARISNARERRAIRFQSMGGMKKTLP
jgi:hypothetical protein